MLLTKSRIPIVTAGFILLLFGFVLFLIAGRASAHNSGDPFGNTATDLTWSWTWDDPTDEVRVCFTLGSRWVTGDLGAVHDIEIFVNPAVTDTPDKIAEGPVNTVATLGDYTYATNTYYCQGRNDANTADVPLVITGINALPAKVGIHLLNVTHTALASGISDTQVAANAGAGTGPSIGDLIWGWTFDKVKGLQTCLQRGTTWTGVADEIQVWVDGTLRTSIAVPAANTISCSVIIPFATGVTAPTTVTLGILNAADKTIGVSPAPVNQNGLIPNDLGWAFQVTGNALQVKVKIGASLPSGTYSIEVYPSPPIAGQENSPALTQGMPGGGALPTDQILDLNVIEVTSLTTSVKVQLRNAAGGLITFNSGAGINTGLTVAPPPPPPPSEPTAVPVATTVVPPAQITTVTAPMGGAVSVIQPSEAATVSAPDGTVAVNVPAVANATTFQLAYNPSPATVPAAPAGEKILRAFELNAYDTGGAQVSISLLKAVTITVRYTSADVVAAPGRNPLNLKIARYDTATQAWTSLNTSVDLAAQTLSATASRFSLFGVVGEEPPPQVVATPTATPALPETGDFAPGSGLVLALILSGFLLMAAGGAYLTQTRRARD